jgi:hypothetical protein
LAVLSCVGDDPADIGSSSADAAPESASSADVDGSNSTDGGKIGPIVSDVREPGSRLQPNWLTLGSAREFVDWWDTKLGAHCNFVELPDGSYRCVPTAPTVFTAENYFADTGCSIKAAQSNSSGAPWPCSAPPPYVTAGNNRECPPVIHKLGYKITSNYYRNPGTGECIGQTSSRDEFVLGAPLPPSEWQDGKIEDGADDTGAAVKAQFIRAGDGSFGFARFTPRQFTTPCAFGIKRPDDVLRCYPTSLATGSLYSDSSCNNTIFSLPYTTCGQPRAVVGQRSVETDPCTYEATSPAAFFNVGGDFSGNYFYRNVDGGACQSAGSTTTGSLQGAPIDTQAVFGAAARARVDVDDRIASDLAVLSTGVATRLGWYDKAKSLDCKLAVAADGKWRCLPKTGGSVTSSSPNGTFYTDAACNTPLKNPIAYVAVPAMAQCEKDERFCPATCSAPPKPAFAFGSAAGCPVGAKVFAVGDAVTVYRRPRNNGPATCTAVNRPGEATYAVTEVAPTEFVEATLSFP